MKVCAVIVTYGDRFHLLKQVVEACYKEGVDKVIVIDNASEKNSKKQLQSYEQSEDRVKVIYLDENTGSAGGYKRGLEEAYTCEECEFIWLLDDDNMPKKDSLNVLKNFWNNLEKEDKQEKISLLSYRPDRTAYKEAIMTNNPNLVLGRKNSFLGFHILDLPKKVMKVLKRKMSIKTFIENPNIKNGEVSVAPYGGMFFHKSMIDSIGYPKKEFFVYADDHEWSYRITKSNGEIILLLDSKLEDIDTSWNVSTKDERSYQIIAQGDPFRVYYGIRNRVYFEHKNLITNKFIYKLNSIVYSILVFLNKKNDTNFKTYKQAITDGSMKKLGKNENFNF